MGKGELMKLKSERGGFVLLVVRWGLKTTREKGGCEKKRGVDVQKKGRSKSVMTRIFDTMRGFIE